MPDRRPRPVLLIPSTEFESLVLRAGLWVSRRFLTDSVRYDRTKNENIKKRARKIFKSRQKTQLRNRVFYQVVGEAGGGESIRSEDLVPLSTGASLGQTMPQLSRAVRRVADPASRIHLSLFLITGRAFSHLAVFTVTIGRAFRSFQLTEKGRHPLFIKQ